MFYRRFVLPPRDTETDEDLFTKTRSPPEAIQTAKKKEKIARKLDLTKDQARLRIDRLLKKGYSKS